MKQFYMTPVIVIKIAAGDLLCFSVEEDCVDDTFEPLVSFNKTDTF